MCRYIYMCVSIFLPAYLSLYLSNYLPIYLPIALYHTEQLLCRFRFVCAARIDQVLGSTLEYRFAPEGLPRARGCALEPSATSRRSPGTDPDVSTL